MNEITMQLTINHNIWSDHKQAHQQFHAAQ